MSLLLPAGIVSTPTDTKEDEGQGQVGGRKNKWIAGVCVVESLHLIIIIIVYRRRDMHNKWDDTLDSVTREGGGLEGPMQRKDKRTCPYGLIHEPILPHCMYWYNIPS